MKENTITPAVITGFQAHLRREEKSEATVRKYLRDAAAFADSLGGAALTKEAVIAFKQTLMDGGYAVRSVNSMLASLNSLFSFLGRHDLKVRTLRVQREVFCSGARELSRAEYERLCRAARQRRDRRLELILQTLCGTGIRVSELRSITAEAVRAGEATVRSKGKTRTVFLVRPLQKKLLRYIAERNIPSGCVFVTRTGRPVDRTAVWRAMKGLCTQAGVDPAKVFPHNLRHLFARVFYALERDIAKLADILGHSSIETTRIYIVSTGAEHRRRMEAMRLIL